MGSKAGKARFAKVVDAVGRSEVVPLWTKVGQDFHESGPERSES